jgi:PAS domain S-box-containing protein
MNTVRSEMRRRWTFYVVPVLIGLGGVVFSQQLDNIVWRYIALIISIALPLYAGSNLLSRYHTSLLERLVMLGGILLLILGAAYSFSSLSHSLEHNEYVSDFIINLSRVIGMLSLFLGLIVVFFAVIRTGEGIDEMADRFRFLAEHISEGFILSVPDGTIILVNQRVLDMFGMEREVVLGKNARDLASSFGLNSITNQLDTRAEGVASEYEVVWHVSGEDRVFLINGAPIFNKQGRHTLTMATVRDITEHRRLTQQVEQYARELQKQVEKQTLKLHKSESRLRHLLVSMNEGFLTLDLKYRIRFVNNQAGALLRLDVQSLKGRDIFEFVDNVSRSRLLNLFAHAVSQADGKGLRQELEFIDSRGVSLPSLVGIAYLNAPDEENIRYSLVITPIGELKKMQQQLVFRARELERANEELRFHDRAKDSFLSNVTHELRTPLTTIQGYIEMFLGNSMGDITEAQRHALAVMERNSGHLLNHINEMIEFSRMQIRGIQAVINLYDAAALGNEAAAAILPSAKDKQLNLHLNIPGWPLYAWGDRDKLHQLLGILLNNAVKFTESGGDITISVDQVNESDVSIAVSDTGIGIKPDYHEKIFTRFFQVDGSKTRKYEGAGIGLSIAQNIVQAHGGAITVESETGKGTTFRVLLPNSVFSKDVDSDVIEAMKEVKLLVIEESEERRKALCSFPPLSLCPVSFAPNGYLASRKLYAEDLDCVVINDAPEDVAGETSLRILGQQSGIGDTPIIVLTNEGGDILKREREDSFKTRFLFKPFSADSLTRLISNILTGRTPEKGDTIEALYHAPMSKPLALIIDADVGFLEWVEMALIYHNIDVFCSTSSARLLDSDMPLRTPDVIFVDADVSVHQLEEALEALQANGTTRNKPVYMITSMSGQQEKIKANNVAGILHKPFPISDMTEIILKASSISS